MLFRSHIPHTPHTTHTPHAPYRPPVPPVAPRLTQRPIAACNPSACRAWGRGLQPKGLRVHETADFRVHTNGAGSGELRVTVRGPRELGGAMGREGARWGSRGRCGAL